MPDIQAIIQEAAQRHGLNPEDWQRIAQIESAGDPTARNKSGATGLFQFMPKTWAQYGRGGDPLDAVGNTDAAMRLGRDNSQRFQSAFSRAPSAGELYLMHQQGAGGATKLLQNPTMRAADLVGHQAVTQNGGHPDMTAQQFADLWTGKFGGASGDPSATPTGATPAPTAMAQPEPGPSPMASALAPLAETARKMKPPSAAVHLNDGRLVAPLLPS